MNKYVVFFLLLFPFVPLYGVLDTITSCPDQYIMDLAEGPDGSIWAVAEAGSVWHYKDNKWTKFDKTTPGFLDTEDFTAVSIDKQGRVWIGSVNAGIAVYNGEIESQLSWNVSGSLTITPNASNKLNATLNVGTSVGEYVVTAACGSSQRIIRVKVVNPKIHTVTFEDNIVIKQDDGTAYSGVFWKDDDLDGDSDMTNANADTTKPYQPVAYLSTDKMKVKPVFKPNCLKSNPIDDEDFVAAYDVEAVVKKVRFAPPATGTPPTYDWSDLANFTLSGVTLTAKNKLNNSAKVEYKSTYVLTWGIGFGEAGTSDSNLNWNTSTSEHELYLTYKAKVSSFETVFHIGCKNADTKTAEDDIVTGVWGGFTGKNVARKDGTNLTYYASYTTSSITLASLLSTTDGQCGAWAKFFQETLSIHGISSRYTVVTPNSFNGEGFIIKTWSFSGSGTSGDASYPYFNDEPTSGDIVGTTSYNWGTTKEVTYDSGTAGQNNSKPAALFNNHQIIYHTGTASYYDASYGIKHTSVQSIDDTLSGFFKTDFKPSGNMIILFKKNPSGNQITVTP